MDRRRWTAGQLVRLATATQAVFLAFWQAGWGVLLVGSFRPEHPHAARLLSDGLLWLAGASVFDTHAVVSLWWRLTMLAWIVLSVCALFRIGRPRLRALTKIGISTAIAALGYAACLIRLWPHAPVRGQLTQAWLGMAFAGVGAAAVSSAWAFGVEWLLWRWVNRVLPPQPSSVRS